MTRSALIVGAGPAGLAAAAELDRAGVSYRLLERGPSLGHTWANLYDSLTLHTGKHMSTLPRLPFPRGTPIFPTRARFLAYLEEYARAKRLRVETGRHVTRIAREGEGLTGSWRATTAEGEVIEASHVVMASGIVANPRRPRFAGEEGYRGRVMHAVEYCRPQEFVGKRVLVVGVGNSGGEIGAELARSGSQVTVAVRSGTHVVPKTIGPFPAQYVRYVLGGLPRAAQEWIVGQVQRRMVSRFGPPVLPPAAHHPLDGIPLIGFGLVDAIREGLIEVKRAGISAYTTDGVRFTDESEGVFDVVLLATGYGAAVQPLGDLVRVDAKGFAIRTGRVASADQPRLFFIGHNYDHTGGLTNIRRDAPLIARAVAAS